MCLFYSEVKEYDNPADNAEEARRRAIPELIKAKEELIKFHKVNNDDIQSRRVIANQSFGDGLQGAYQSFHVVKEDTVVEILEFFYTYDGTFVNVFSHDPNAPQSEEDNID